jgi:hypothetical protein
VRTERSQRPAVGVVAVQVRHEDGVDGRRDRRRRDATAQMRHATPEDGVGQEAEAVDLDEDGGMAEPGQAVDGPDGADAAGVDASPAAGDRRRRRRVHGVRPAAAGLKGVRGRPTSWTWSQ